MKSKEELSEIQSVLKKIQSALKKYENYKNEIEEMNNEWSDKKNQITELNSSIRHYEKEMQKLQDEIHSSKKEYNYENEKQYLTRLHNEYKMYTRKQSEYEQKKSIYNIVQELLKDSGMKTTIIKQYVPKINMMVNKYLAQLDFFVDFHLDENFNEVIKSRHRDEFKYQNFSEGEKLRIDLALLFAWRAVAKMKNSINCNLLILDEIFDSSLDVNGTEEFIKILNEFTKDTNTFIISHKVDILSDKFKNEIRFEKKNGFSRMVGE